MAAVHPGFVASNMPWSDMASFFMSKSLVVAMSNICLIISWMLAYDLASKSTPCSPHFPIFSISQL